MPTLPAGTVRGRRGSKEGGGGGGGRAVTRGEPRGDGAAVEGRSGGEADLGVALWTGLVLALGLGVLPLEPPLEVGRSLSRAASSCAQAVLLSGVKGRARSCGCGATVTWPSCSCTAGLSAVVAQKMLTLTCGGARGHKETVELRRVCICSAHAVHMQSVHAARACGACTARARHVHGACTACARRVHGMCTTRTGGLPPKSLAALPSPRRPPCRPP